jgi:hypothetical protein
MAIVKRLICSSAPEPITYAPRILLVPIPDFQFHVFPLLLPSSRHIRLRPTSGQIIMYHFTIRLGAGCSRSWEPPLGHQLQPRGIALRSILVFSLAPHDLATDVDVVPRAPDQVEMRRFCLPNSVVRLSRLVVKTRDRQNDPEAQIRRPEVTVSEGVALDWQDLQFYHWGPQRHRTRCR